MGSRRDSLGVWDIYCIMFLFLRDIGLCLIKRNLIKYLRVSI